ncbi:MAG TPA: hypothetical protein VK327_02700 [Candidatus Paceibacterota bacterium]|nr:hypothetical protein [Candidatus Paceibacterota bacterium]
MPYRQPITVAIQGFLCFDQRINVEYPAFSKRQFKFNAVLCDFIEIPDPENFSQAIHNAQVRFQVQVLEGRALFGCQSQRQIGSRTMDWIQVRKCPLNLHQVRFRKPAADIHIASYESDTVSHRRESTDQNEFDFSRNQPPNQIAKILHGDPPWPFSATPQNSRRRHLPASAPTA